MTLDLMFASGFIEHRREKSLGLLAQNFIKLFLSCGVSNANTYIICLIET